MPGSALHNLTQLPVAVISEWQTGDEPILNLIVGFQNGGRSLLYRFNTILIEINSIKAIFRRRELLVKVPICFTIAEFGYINLANQVPKIIQSFVGAIPFNAETRQINLAVKLPVESPELLTDLRLAHCAGSA